MHKYGGHKSLKIRILLYTMSFGDAIIALRNFMVFWLICKGYEVIDEDADNKHKFQHAQRMLHI